MLVLRTYARVLVRCTHVCVCVCVRLRRVFAFSFTALLALFLFSRFSLCVYVCVCVCVFALVFAIVRGWVCPLLSLGCLHIAHVQTCTHTRVRVYGPS